MNVDLVNDNVYTKCFAEDNDFDVASVIVFIFAYGVHYFFIFSLSFDHFTHFLNQLLSNIFQYPFASFAFLRSKYILLCSVTII